MQTDTPSNKTNSDGATELPDTTTLAHLAAQSRFANLDPERAAKDALFLWQVCDNVRRTEEANVRANSGPSGQLKGWMDRQRFDIPQPKTWPATLSDFYRVVMREKDEAK